MIDEEINHNIYIDSIIRIYYLLKCTLHLIVGVKVSYTWRISYHGHYHDTIMQLPFVKCDKNGNTLELLAFSMERPNEIERQSIQNKLVLLSNANIESQGALRFHECNAITAEQERSFRGGCGGRSRSSMSCSWRSPGNTTQSNLMQLLPCL